MKMKNKDIIEQAWQDAVREGLIAPSEDLNTRAEWAKQGKKPIKGIVAVKRVKLWIYPIGGECYFSRWTNLYASSQVKDASAP